MQRDLVGYFLLLHQIILNYVTITKIVYHYVAVTGV